MKSKSFGFGQVLVAISILIMLGSCGKDPTAGGGQGAAFESGISSQVTG